MSQWGLNCSWQYHQGTATTDRSPVFVQALLIFRPMLAYQAHTWMKGWVGLCPTEIRTPDSGRHTGFSAFALYHSAKRTLFLLKNNYLNKKAFASFISSLTEKIPTRVRYYFQTSLFCPLRRFQETEEHYFHPFSQIFWEYGTLKI